jgi:hypothetical protein
MVLKYSKILLTTVPLLGIVHAGDWGSDSEQIQAFRRYERLHQEKQELERRRQQNSEQSSTAQGLGSKRPSLSNVSQKISLFEQKGQNIGNETSSRKVPQKFQKDQPKEQIRSLADEKQRIAKERQHQAEANRIAEEKRRAEEEAQFQEAIRLSLAEETRPVSKWINSFEQKNQTTGNKTPSREVSQKSQGSQQTERIFYNLYDIQPESGEAKEKPLAWNALPDIDFTLKDPIARARKKFEDKFDVSINPKHFNSYWNDTIDETLKSLYGKYNFLRTPDRNNIKFVTKHLSNDDQIPEQFFELKDSSGRGNNCMLYSIIGNDVDFLTKILGSRGDAEVLLQERDEGERDYSIVRQKIIADTIRNLNRPCLTPNGSQITLWDYLGSKFKDSSYEVLKSTDVDVETKLISLGYSDLMFESWFANVLSVLYERAVYVLMPQESSETREKDPHYLIPTNPYELVLPDNSKTPIFIHHDGNGGLHYSKLVPTNDYRF